MRSRELSSPKVAGAKANGATAFGEDAMPPHVAAFENVDIEIGAAENDYADRPVRLHGR